MERRDFLIGALAFSLLPGCERHRYQREIEQKGKVLDLGPVSRLLYTQVHLRTKAVLLFRDIDGWSALSTRCTYKGCDLTVQEPILLCPCCKTPYDMSGLPYSGYDAVHPLPWVKLSYKDGHIYANMGEVVSSKERFTTPEIEKAIRKLRRQVQDESIKDGVRIPESVQGSKDPDHEKSMFKDGPDMF